jgi:DNA-binding NtrC family response regulator
MHRHVLVVDDDPEIRSILATVMQWDGYEVLTADDGETALEMMRASPDPLVVTLDLRMRQHSGLAVLEAVAADDALAQRHAIVLVTGVRGLALQDRVRVLRDQLGIPLIEKPLDLRELLDAVEEVQQRREVEGGNA